MAVTLTSKRYQVQDVGDAIEFCFQQGWTDGLPVVPPTEERVSAMLEAARLDPEQQVALHHPPRGVDHGREGRDQRGDGRLQARVHGGRRGRGRGDRRSALELPRAGHVDRRRRRAHDRQRPDRARAGHQRRRQPLRAGLARQSHHRPRPAPGHAQRLRLAARAARPRHPRPSRQAVLRDRRERGGEPVDAAARRARVPARAEHGHGDGRRGAAPVLQPALEHAGGRAHHARRRHAASPAARGRQPHYVVILAGEHMRTIAQGGWGKKEIRQFLFEHTQNSIAHLKRTNRMPGRDPAGRRDEDAPARGVRRATSWSSRPAGGLARSRPTSRAGAGAALH